MKQIGLGVFLILAGLFLGRCVLWPPEPPRPPTPTKTDTVFVSDTVIEERDRWRVEKDTVLLTQRVTVFDTIRIACRELKPRYYILGAEFGEEYGDTTSVLTESVSFSRDSLNFQNTIEDIYTNGMPRRISIDSTGVGVEWRDFPTQDNSISILEAGKWMGIGIGGYIVVDGILDLFRDSKE